MARKPVRDLPTDAESAPGDSAVSGNAIGASARIVREEHICAFALDVNGIDMWAAQICKMANAPKNTDRGRADGGNDRRQTRIEVLGNAIGTCPYLIRKVEGRKRVGNPAWDPRLRPIGLAKYEGPFVKFRLPRG